MIDGGLVVFNSRVCLAQTLGSIHYIVPASYSYLEILLGSACLCQTRKYYGNLG